MITPHPITSAARGSALFLATTLAGLAGVAQAQDNSLASDAASDSVITTEQKLSDEAAAEPRRAPDGYRKGAERRGVYFFGNLGIAAGGDRLATVQVNEILGDETDEVSIRAGDGVHLLLGAGMFVPRIPLSFQFGLGVHYNGISSFDDSAGFGYAPLEAGAFYHLGRHRLGGGLMLALSPELDLTDTNDGRVDYEEAFGAWFQYEFMWNFMSVGLRLTALEFEPESVSGFTDLEVDDLPDPDGSFAALTLSFPF
ncbi:MAG: hypothetical protein CSB44_09335 [Gammaproteobacteria bacterium]|nr:MAG: hypothetical protein CSB44_09335 [Gammaproteobacteria bacterium]